MSPLLRPCGRRAAALLALVLALSAVACAPDGTRGAVHVAQVDGAVDNVLERYVDRVLDHAEATGAALVVLEVDTPGGELGAMKRTAGRIEQAAVPVVAWVGPPGAQAVSAGTFIVMAAHVAAMAPSTSIGAASPILASGQDIPETLGRKVEEDTVSFARAVAEQHDRNADWAEAAVREAASASPSSALDLGVIDLVAPTRSALLDAVEGREVAYLDGGSATIEASDAPLVVNGMNVYERVLKIVASPTVVGLLLLVAMGGLAIEFFSPGLLLPGTAGVLALLLAFLGAGTLLPTEAAVAFLLLGAALIAAEFFVPGGILGAVGVVALLLAFGIGAGQTSTVVSAERVIVTLVIVVLVAAAGAFLFLRRFLEPADYHRPEAS
ncbi:MAG: nodulation protein NfeD [Dehalococcoidia bacterium]